MAAPLDAPAQRARRRAAAAELLLTIGALTITVLGPRTVLADEPPPTGSRSFDVMELRVIGNTSLPARDIESAVYPFTGPQKQMTDVEAARAALERIYHDKGFGTVFVDIPEQSIDNGIVRLRVTEGRLHQVRVAGAKYFSGRELLAEIPTAQANTVPNLPQLQKEINAVNAESRDRTVVPVLKAGPQPGTVDLSLKVEDHVPFHGSAELNNQYTADTAHLRAAVQASYDNMFGRMDSLALQFQGAPTAYDESHVFAGSYTLHLGQGGSNLSFQYVNSKSDVLTIGTLGVLGTGSVYGLRWLTPLPSAGSLQSLAFEVDYKDFKQSILVNPTSGLDTPVDYINLTAAYSGIRATNSSQWDWSTTANFGLRGAPNNAQQFAGKRGSEASANYFYLRSDGGVTFQLPASLNAALRLTGQYSADALISNEQFPIGGAASVRGYLEAEQLGDSGLRGSFQFGGPPLVIAAGRLHINEFLFYDIAREFTVDSPGQPHFADLRSWGVGLKFDAVSHLYGALTWAYPLVDSIRTPKGASTVLFVIRGYW